MAELALPLMIAGTGASAVSQIMQGREQSRAAQFESQQLRIQKQTTEIQAAQQEAQRREELTSSLETIQAIRAGRGVGAYSPGGMALFDKITKDQEYNISNEKIVARSKAESSGIAADLADAKGRTSLLAGYLGAASTVGSMATRYYGYSNYPVTLRGS